MDSLYVTYVFGEDLLTDTYEGCCVRHSDGLLIVETKEDKDLVAIYNKDVFICLEFKEKEEEKKIYPIKGDKDETK